VQTTNYHLSNRNNVALTPRDNRGDRVLLLRRVEENEVFLKREREKNNEGKRDTKNTTLFTLFISALMTMTTMIKMKETTTQFLVAVVVVAFSMMVFVSANKSDSYEILQTRFGRKIRQETESR
jgi:hypothetical protein